MLKALEPWKAVVDQMAQTKIARSRVYLDNRCRKKECNLGNLITDAMVDSVRGKSLFLHSCYLQIISKGILTSCDRLQYVDKAENQTFWTYAAIAVVNPGGIRASIDSMGDDITYGDLMMVQPFENTWDTIELNGSCIVQVFL